MTIRTGIVPTLAAAVGASLVLAGCSSTTPGSAPPVPSAGATSTSSADENVFGNLNACEILAEVGSSQGFGQGENKTSRNECVAVKPDTASYALALDSVQGLAEFAASNAGAVKININGRNAMQADTNIDDGCAVAIEVSPRARAIVVVTMVNPSDAARACPTARQFAEQVEPLLPKAH